MKIKSLLPAAAAAAALLVSGCGYEVLPLKPPQLEKAPAALPLKVGVMAKNAGFDWSGVGMTNSGMDAYRNGVYSDVFKALDDAPDVLVQTLKDSGLFAQVDKVNDLGFAGTDRGGHDILIDAEIRGKYVQDPGQTGKAMITGFLMFLPGPFITYDDSYQFSADVTLYDADGRLLHKYSDSAETESHAMLFSANKPSTLQAGIAAASKALAVKIASDVLADRDGYEKQASGLARTAKHAGVAPPAESARAAEVATATAAAAGTLASAA
ncbi:MAG: hypothetical protein KGM24_08245, partial [Elusimicrobia bacterium]|nr:hypothetical protein [Elusimicrobiota bacterium]